MKRLFVCLLIVFAATATAHAAQSDLPDWVLPELSRYPVETFLFDVGRERGIGEKSFEIAAAEAQEEAAKRIVDIVRRILNANSNDLQYNMVVEHYSTVLVSSEAMKLSGLQDRNLTVDLARPDRDTYAIAYVNRAELKAIYKKRESDLRRKIRRILDKAQAAEDNLDIPGAVQKYLSTYPLYEALREAELIQQGAAYNPPLTRAFAEMVQAATATDENSFRHVVKRVAELEEKPIVSLEDVAYVAASQLLRQVRRPDSEVWIEPFTYEDSGMCSPPHLIFVNGFQQKIEWDIVERMRGFTKENVNIRRTHPQLKLYGTYWENGDELTLRAALRNVTTGAFLAATVVPFRKSELRYSPPIAFEPPDYQRARVEKEAFTPPDYAQGGRGMQKFKPKVYAEKKVFASGSLMVETWTNKGSGPVLYTEDETMKVFARVNQAAYIRLLYILPDGRYTLLQDDYYIDASQTNTDVEMGEFRCTPPFGVELLVVAARTKPFPDIETFKEDGYFYLAEKDVQLAADKFRGMQRIEDSNTYKPLPPDVQQDEAQIVLTTLAK